MAIKWLLFLSCVGLTVSANSSGQEFWKGTALDNAVEKIRLSCADHDTIACLQFKAFTFLDNLFRGFKLSDHVEVSRNTYNNEISSRSADGNLEDDVVELMKSHDVKFKIPAIGAITIDSKSLDKEEIDLKLNFGDEGTQTEARRKKHKLRRIITPILVFVLLKAITLVPLAIGVLGLKAWNGLQLAFFSFIISTGLAIFQLCQKLATESAHSHAHITTAAGWEPTAHLAARSSDAQNLAYSAYTS